MSHCQTFQRPKPIADEPRQPPRLNAYMPATPPLELLSIVEFWFGVYWRRRHFRRQFLPLLKGSDQILDDLGFNRCDIRWALALPVSVNALHALAACRKARQCFHATQAVVPQAEQNVK